jgi:hypothetical protein
MDRRSFEARRFIENVKVSKTFVHPNTKKIRPTSVLLSHVLQAMHASAAAQKGVHLVVKLAPDLPDTLIGPLVLATNILLVLI